MASPRILVIEDNPLQREVVADLLGGEGYDVAVAGTAAEALSAIRERRPELVILDLMLPDLDGATLLSKIRAEAGMSGVRVLVTTAMQARQLSRLLGADRVLSKPFDVRELVGAVTALLPLVAT
jgi:DNA-binding response OmpR family regulator